MSHPTSPCPCVYLQAMPVVGESFYVFSNLKASKGHRVALRLWPAACCLRCATQCTQRTHTPAAHSRHFRMLAPESPALRLAPLPLLFLDHNPAPTMFGPPVLFCRLS
jgi:Fe-S oxidoreductase